MGDSAWSGLDVKEWFAVHVKSRHEQVVDKLLREQRLETFLPMREIQRKWSDRTKIVRFPLFPNYLFVHACSKDKRNIITTRSVVGLVGKPDPVAVPLEHIDAIKKFIDEDVQIDPYPHYTPGREVEVRKGPFKGIRGVLNRKKGKYRLFINMQLINQSAAIEIDIDDVALLD